MSKREEAAKKYLTHLKRGPTENIRLYNAYQAGYDAGYRAAIQDAALWVLENYGRANYEHCNGMDALEKEGG